MNLAPTTSMPISSPIQHRFLRTAVLVTTSIYALRRRFKIPSTTSGAWFGNRYIQAHEANFSIWGSEVFLCVFVCFYPMTKISSFTLATPLTNTFDPRNNRMFAWSLCWCDFLRTARSRDTAIGQNARNVVCSLARLASSLLSRANTFLTVQTMLTIPMETKYVLTTPIQVAKFHSCRFKIFRRQFSFCPVIVYRTLLFKSCINIRV